MPNKETMVSFWRAVMTDASDVTPAVGVRLPTIEALWDTICGEEVKKAFPETSTSPGPDGITSRQLRAVPLDILTRIFNIVLICGRLPERLFKSRTTLIPKKDNAVEPGNFRPITDSSVITRTLHKILAKRLMRHIELDKRQKAFIPADGCVENTFKFDLLLRYHRQNFKPLYLASIDIAKAFDSVTHQSIMDTLGTMGLPSPMISYVEYVYKNSKTKLSCNGWVSDEIRPTCGVKQGDPLSPTLFNMVIDRLLHRVPREIAVDIAGQHYNAFAFADDLVLIASTPQGLQMTLDIVTGFLAECGLAINTGKSFTVAIRNVPHMKKSVVDSNIKFRCDGRDLPSMRREDEWKYLGVTPEGRTLASPEGQLREALTKLTKAPLKPQQRLFALRVMVLPGLYHVLTLGGTNLSRLKRVDTLICGAVRKWLALPHDTVNAYFHANAIKEKSNLSLLLLQGLVRRAVDPRPFISQEISVSRRRLKEGQTDLNCKAKIDKRWADLLHASSNGKALTPSKEVPQQHQWVTEGNRFLSGGDFINSLKLRINALPTNSRSKRGRIASRRCRAGCNEIEKLNHIMQRCHRTHAARVARHDAVVFYLARALKKKYERVDVEPHFQTPEGLRKPDLVAKLGQTALVVDAQVVGEQVDLATAHERKTDYYQELRKDMEARYEVTSVVFTSATLTCRGLWCRTSVEDLLRMDVIKKKEVKVLSSRVLIGGMNAYRIFSKSTAAIGRRPRTGIG